MTTRTTSINLVDESGNQLTDESGNHLTAHSLIEDYTLTAKESQLILHGYEPIGDYNIAMLMSTLVNQDGDILTDESGNHLTARFQTGSRLLHADITQTILHGG